MLILGFDLNLPLDEYGTIDFDFVQILTSLAFSTSHMLYCWIEVDHAVEAPVKKQVEETHQMEEMSKELRKKPYQVLLARSKNGKLGKKDTTIIVDQFHLHIRSVQRLWSEVQYNLQTPF